MSEQTPDTSNGMTDGQEPSMEDILASIRKIIADDDAMAQENTLDSQETVGLSQDILSTDIDMEAMDDAGVVTELNAFENRPIETLDLDIVSEETTGIDSDIDQLLSVTDDIENEDLQLTEVDFDIAEAENELDDILDLEIPVKEDEFAPTEIAVAETVVPAEDITELAEDSADDDLALMLDNMLDVEETEAPLDVQAAELAPAEEPLSSEDILDEVDVLEDDELEDLLFDTDTEMTEGASIEEDADMNLVKSLMADLTEEPLHEDEINEVEAFESDLVSDIPDIDTNVEDDVDDVMDEILTMTMDDEIQLQEAIEIPEIDETLETLVSEDTQTSSLLDIAAEAEADALAIDGGDMPDLSTGLMAGAVAAMGVATISADKDETDDVDQVLSDLDALIAPDNSEIEDINPTPETEMSQEETPDMARAAKKDTIIDEVTETATAGAFASLSNVVEEKAVVAERGDRVGDLVMEALRPMLKEWLDANLKGIVERAVTKEVKRISSGK